MVEYNAKFIDVMNLDLRLQKLKQHINQHSKSYEYYNLALCYKTLFSAYTYFRKAYSLILEINFWLWHLLQLKEFTLLEQYIESTIISPKDCITILDKPFINNFNPTTSINTHLDHFTDTIFIKLYITYHNIIKVTSKWALFLDNSKVLCFSA